MDGTSEIQRKETVARDQLADENKRLRSRVRDLERTHQKAGRVSGDLGDLDYTQVTTASLAAVIELMPVAAAVFDGERKLVASNAAYARDAKPLSIKLRQGLPFKDIIQAVVDASWLPLDNGTAEEWCQSWLRDLENCTTRDQKFPDGTLFRISVRRTADDGRLILRNDLTELEKERKAHRQTEERFRAAFEKAGIGMTISGGGTDLVAVNDAMCRLLGYNETELLEKQATDFTHPDFVPALLEEREQILAGKAPKPNIERCLIRKDGQLVWVLLNRSRIENSEGSNVYVIAQYQDISERKRTEEALRQSEARLTDFASISADRFWETDAEHRFSNFFSIRYSVSGELREQALGKTRWEWAEADLDDPMWRRHLEDLEARKPFRDFRYSKIDSGTRKTIHLKISGVPVFGDNGEFKGYRGTAVDETREVEARALADGAKARLYAAMEGAPQGIAHWDANEKLIYCNKEFIKIYPHLKSVAKPGLRAKDLVKAHSAAGWHMEEGDQAHDVTEFRKTEHAGGADREFETTDGRKWVRIRSRELADGSTIKFHTDITANKTAEIALRDSEELFRSSFDDTKVPMVMISKDDRFQRTNRAFSKLIGYNKSQLANIRPLDLIHPRDRSRVENIRKLLVSRRRSTKDEIRMVRGDGHTIWCQINWTAIVNAQGETDHWIAHLADVTEAKRAERVVQSDHEILSSVATGVPLPEVLVQITRSVEQLNSDFKCAVMLYDRDVNALRVGVAESFSEDFRTAVKQIGVGPNAGSCGIAAHTGKRVIAEDLADPKKSKVRQEAAIAMGLRSCVSQPIFSSDKQLLGTLAVYSRQVGKPSRAELNYIASGASLAGIAISRERTLKEIQGAAEKVSATIGNRYFQSLVDYVQEVLSVDYAIVGKVIGSGRDRVQTIAVQSNGRLTENFEYQLEGAPCQVVTAQRACFFSRGVTKKFPNDEMLAELGIEGYAGTPLKDSAGRVIGLLVVLSKTPLQRSEMTMSLLQIFAARAGAELERMGVELDLRESESRLFDFASATADRFWETDRNHNIVYVSSSAGDMDGGSSDGMIGKRLWERPDIHVDADALAAHQKLLKAYEPFRDFRFIVTDDKGRQFHLRSSGKPLFDDDGNFTGYRGTSVDETSAIETQRRAKSANQRFLNALNNAPDGVTYWDSDGRFVMSNGHFKRISHDAAAILVPGTSFEDYISERARTGTRLTDSPTETAEEAREKIMEYFRGGHAEYEFMRGERWFRNRIRKIEDGSTIMYMSDITDIRRREDEYRQALKMEAVGNLTGGVAHDFNNILAAALGNLELVLDDIESKDKTTARVERAIKAVQRGGELTKRLLAFSRKQTLQPIPIDLREMVHDTVDLLKRTLGEQITIKSSFDADLWPTLADRNQLENALVNLAINARDAMPNGGNLSFEASNFQITDNRNSRLGDLIPGDYVVLAVRDSGAGIPPENLTLVFDPFFTTKDVGQGSGLGLSQVYGFVKQSGGHVELESNVGVGTSVKIYLPRAEVGDAKDEDEGLRASIPRGNGERVLVIEDDPDVREVTISILDGLGYKTLDGGDGSEVDDRMRKGAGSVDLVLTDVVLPGGITGPDIAERIKQRFAETKILLMTGYAEGGVILSDSRHLKFPLINKPFDASDLARKLRQTLDEVGDKHAADGGRA